MSEERELSEKEIDDHLKKLMEDLENSNHVGLKRTLKLLLILVYNLRLDHNELKIKMLEFFKGEGIELEEKLERKITNLDLKNLYL